MKSSKHAPASWAVVVLVAGLLFSLLAHAQGQVTVSIDAPDEVAEGADFIARVNIIEVTDFDAANYDVIVTVSIQIHLCIIPGGSISGDLQPEIVLSRGCKAPADKIKPWAGM